MSLSPEREKHIRETVDCGAVPAGQARDLLAEIDRLRVELSDRESNVQDLQEVAESWMNDADHFQEKLKVAEHIFRKIASKSFWAIPVMRGLAREALSIIRDEK